MSLFDENTFDGPALVGHLLQQWKLLVAIPLVAGGIAVLITAFTAPVYEASGILIPPRDNDPDAIITDLQFGYDIEADRLIQMLESETMRSRVINLINLDQYYGINRERKDWLSLVSKRYKNDVKIVRTRYMSVVVKARFRDPDLAAKVVNTLIGQANAVRNEVLRTGLAEQLESTQQAYEQRQTTVNKVGDSLFNLSNEKGKESVALFYYRMRFLQGKEPDRDALLELLSDQPTPILLPMDEQLVMEYLFEQRQLEQLRDRLARINYRLTQPMSGVYVVDHAQPDYRKVWPSITLNVLVSMAISLLLLIAVLAIVFRWRALQQKA